MSIKSYTVSWDGDTEGRDSAEMGVDFYKISELTPAADALLSPSLTVAVSGTELALPLSVDYMYDEEEGEQVPVDPAIWYALQAEYQGQSASPLMVLNGFFGLSGIYCVDLAAFSEALGADVESVTLRWQEHIIDTNKVVYAGKTLIDLTEDTVAADKLMKGYTAHDASGAPVVGTAEGGAPAGVTLCGSATAKGSGSGGNQAAATVKLAFAPVEGAKAYVIVRQASYNYDTGTFLYPDGKYPHSNADAPAYLFDGNALTPWTSDVAYTGVDEDGKFTFTSTYSVKSSSYTYYVRVSLSAYALT